MQAAIAEALVAGGVVQAGGDRLLADAAPGAYYVQPALVQMPGQRDVVRRETFAPLLYVLSYTDLDEAIALNNAVPQGLASSIFTSDQREAEEFMTAGGADSGLVNVNIGTSGAEIGGALLGQAKAGLDGAEKGSVPGRATCAGRPIRSTTPARFPSPRASGSRSDPAAGRVAPRPVAAPCLPERRRLDRPGRPQ